MHEQKLKEKGLGYIDPKQNSVITTHGFRSTFRDWSTDKTDYPREVEAACLRGGYIEKRKGLMSNWAIYCGA